MTIRLLGGQVTKFEQCSNRLQLDLISFWSTVWKIIIRYDFLEALQVQNDCEQSRLMMPSNVSSDFNMT